MANLVLSPQTTLQGEINVPGDKSLTHRLLMLSSLALGTSTIYNGCTGQDCLTTVAVLRQLGVTIRIDSDVMTVQGVGKHGLTAPITPLDCQNSGTTMRLLMGLLSGANIACQLDGDASLRTRPMARVMVPLAQMGAAITATTDATAPIQLKKHGGLRAIEYVLPMASAQVKSAILLAGLYAHGETRVIEPSLTRDHTERLLSCYGYPWQRNHTAITLNQQGNLQALNYEVPGDISAAAFFMVAATILPNANLLIRNVGVNPTRTGVIHILSLMGADIATYLQPHAKYEPVADIQVRAATLTGIVIGTELAALAIDEFPIIFVAAACAQGITEIRGIQELRVKETDRIHAMVVNLRALGIVVQELPDGVIIEGGQLCGGHVNSYGDHRIAMAMAVASLVATDDVYLENPHVAAVSFPNFYQILSIPIPPEDAKIITKYSAPGEGF